MNPSANEAPSAHRSGKTVFWLSTAVMSLSWLVWWLAFYPGLMSSDSIDIWAQAQTLQMYNWHPYLYTLVLGLLKYIAYSPSMMGLLQIVLAAFLIAAIASFAYRKGVSVGMVAGIVAVYALHPQFGTYATIIWKDIVYSIVVLAEAFLLYLATREHRDDWWPYAALGLLAGLSVCLRVNAVVNLILVPLLLLLIKVGWKRVGLTVLSAAVAYGVFGVALYRVLGVRDLPFQMDQVRVKTVGAIYNLEDPDLSRHERAVFESMWPASVWRAEYSASSSNQLFFNRFLKLPEVRSLTAESAEDSEFYRSWTDAVTSAALKNVEALALDKFMQAPYFLLKTDAPWIYLDEEAPNAAELKAVGYPRVDTVVPQPVSSILRELCAGAMRFTKGPARFVLWASFTAVVAHICLLVAAVRKKLKATTMFVGYILVNFASVVLLAPSSDYRYVYFVYMSVFAGVLLLVAERQACTADAASPAHAAHAPDDQCLSGALQP